MTLDSSATSASPLTEAELSFKFACIWSAKGKFTQAIAGFEKTLELQPDHVQAAIHLDYIRQQQRWLQAQPNPKPLPDNPNGKLNLGVQKTLVAHRCGWNFAIHALRSLHNPQGILFDGFLEDSFLWQARTSGQKRNPYTQPWVGFLHNPPAMPSWFYQQDSPQALFTQANWQESLKSCVGLFTLSEYFAQWLRTQVDLPVSALIYPTEIPELQFSYDRFLANPSKKIIQLGWWLRKLASIYQLPIATNNPLGYQKIKLNPAFTTEAEDQLQQLVAKQIEVEQITLNPVFLENTQEVNHVSNQRYDELLSENIGFIHLYDASANTALIECISRATPLLVNPLPAVIEYLGEEYPLYFNTLAEAAEKAMDLDLIQKTHQYLKACPTREKLSAEYFAASMQASEVYQRIKL
ncbi:tetratricopeptide repeat protein [Leptolyngbya boryana CZ1]|uniref:Tetratricopeptide repeat protein n=1 Tax=Leptolyngbya boryana CZ1 TaxID=3060204 RepID=A0AA96WZH3_LEPBY|nr:tetratricopeptide repeat protein [Leptolyngbya boryana]WNZ46984.1 tetratricopeptide repeat protein [Leptolyngbya boryana CZ1]